MPDCSSVRRINPGVGLAITVTAIISLALLTQEAYAVYPRIERLHPTDPLYVQLQNDLQEYYRAVPRRAELPPLLIYEYVLGEDESLFSASARLGLPYASIASLNGIENAQLGLDRDVLLVPNQPGLFVPETARSELERALKDRFGEESGEESGEEPTLRVFVHGELRTLTFHPGTDFSATERVAFLSRVIRMPLDQLRLTSPFGMRDHPITGVWSDHPGIDLAAPLGTPVYAARSGRVAAMGYDEVYGNYILLAHSGGYETFYGHLDETAVVLNQEIRSGTILATVGNTGLSTGPHLHFEIRVNGVSQDPGSYLQGVRR